MSKKENGSWWDPDEYMYYGNNYGYGYMQKKCHETPKLAFEADGIRYWGGKAYEFPYVNDAVSLHVDLTGKTVGGEFTNVRKLMPLLDRSGVSYKVIVLNWIDQSSFRWTKDDFIRFHEICKDERFTDVFVGCQGGHGRTGTFLAILAGLLLGVDDPIAYIREKVCDECVESSLQVEYIGKLLGINTKKYARTKYVYIKETQSSWTIFNCRRCGRLVYTQEPVTDLLCWTCQRELYGDK